MSSVDGQKCSEPVSADDLLGVAALGHQIDVAVIDIVRGNPLAE